MYTVIVALLVEVALTGALVVNIAAIVIEYIGFFLIKKLRCPLIFTQKRFKGPQL